MNGRIQEPLGKRVKISAIVHTLNEEERLAGALESLAGWVDEILVIDMHSTDRTVEIARRYTDRIYLHDRLSAVEGARNWAATLARYSWVFYLDADERVPAELAKVIRQMVDSGMPDDLNAVVFPRRNFLATKWIRHTGRWWPGYTFASLARQGTFDFSSRIHGGMAHTGRATWFPPLGAELAIEHHTSASFDALLAKNNRYAGVEAAEAFSDGKHFSWQEAVAGFVRDFHLYYDRNAGQADGPHGFVLSFASAFFRFAAEAKLFEQRYRAGILEPAELAVPPSLEAMLEHALAIAREMNATTPSSSSPLVSLRDGLLALVAAFRASELPLAVLDVGWDLGDSLLDLHAQRGILLSKVPVPATARRPSSPAHPLDLPHGTFDLITFFDALAPGAPAGAMLDQLARQLAPNGLLAATLADAAGSSRSVAIFNAATLTVPQLCQEVLAGFQEIQVAGPAGRRALEQAGIPSDRIRVVPPVVDVERFSAGGAAMAIAEGRAFNFLALVDANLTSGWDIVTTAFATEFTPDDDVALLLKTLPGTPPGKLGELVADLLENRLGLDLEAVPDVVILEDEFAEESMPALYRAAQTFVYPRRLTGRATALREAMALGVPAIGPAIGPALAQDSPEIGKALLVACTQEPIPDEFCTPLLTGCSWSVMHVAELRRAMRSAVDDPQAFEALAQSL